MNTATEDIRTKEMYLSPASYNEGFLIGKNWKNGFIIVNILNDMKSCKREEFDYFFY